MRAFVIPGRSGGRASHSDCSKRYRPPVGRHDEPGLRFDRAGSEGRGPSRNGANRNERLKFAEDPAVFRGTSRRTRCPARISGSALSGKPLPGDPLSHPRGGARLILSRGSCRASTSPPEELPVRRTCHRTADGRRWSHVDRPPRSDQRGDRSGPKPREIGPSGRSCCSNRDVRASNAIEPAEVVSDNRVPGRAASGLVTRAVDCTRRPTGATRPTRLLQA